VDIAAFPLRAEDIYDWSVGKDARRFRYEAVTERVLSGVRDGHN